jgi:hypothetical protein
MSLQYIVKKYTQLLPVQTFITPLQLLLMGKGGGAAHAASQYPFTWTKIAPIVFTAN